MSVRENSFKHWLLSGRNNFRGLSYASKTKLIIKQGKVKLATPLLIFYGGHWLWLMLLVFNE